MIKVKQLTDGFPMTDKAGLFKIKQGLVTLCPFQRLLALSSDRAAVAPEMCVQSRVTEQANVHFSRTAGPLHRLAPC